MKAKVSSLLDHPRWVMAVAVLVPALLWAYALYFMVDRIGEPFEGFMHGADGWTGYLSPTDYPGYVAGLRPGDFVVAVNGQPWAQYRRVLSEVGIGHPAVYTVLRGGEFLQITIPTTEFTVGIILRFIPAPVLFCIVAMAVALFLYAYNPSGFLNRLILFYNTCWAVQLAVFYDQFLGRQTWTGYLLFPVTSLAYTAGFTFFWSFPADRRRREFLRRWPLIQVFWIVGIVAAIYFLVLRVLALSLGTPQLYGLLARSGRVYNLATTFGTFIIKGLPLLLVGFRKDAPLPTRKTAWVLLMAFTLGWTGHVVFIGAAVLLLWPPPASPQWAGILLLAYPLSIGYTVLRYQLFDTRVVIRRGLVYSILTASLTAVFLVLSMAIGYVFQSWTGQQTFVAAVLPALVVAVMFRPAQGRVQNLVDRAFFRHEYEVRQTLTGFSRGLSTLRDQDEVVRLVLETITQTLGAESATFWLLDAEHNVYRPRQTSEVGETSEVLGELPAADELPFWLFAERRALLLLPSDTTAAGEELRQLGAVLAVPLLAEQRLLGFLTVGTKRSGLLYTDDDLELLGSLAQSAGLALENARLHEERLAMLREQLAQVTAAQEEERQRIARELHDGVGPALASLNLRLRTAGKLVQPNEAAAQELAELAELTQANIQDIRRLIYDLRPAVLDELGLVAALEEYVERYEEEQGLQVRLRVPEGKERLPGPLETTLFRVIQEGLTNAARHAKARRVEVTLDWDEVQVALRIVDDGRGFDLREAAGRTKGGRHLGLWSMRERVEQLGGRLQIESQPGSGTTIEATVPVKTAPHGL
jgi:signal transduction histidine kinase